MRKEKLFTGLFLATFFVALTWSFTSAENTYALNNIISGVKASGSDQAGTVLTITGGAGTGTGASGYIGQTYPLLTTTGTVVQSASTLKNYVGGFIYVTTADLTLTASTSTTGTLIGAQTNALPQGTLTLDANLMRVASTIRIRAFGLMTTTGSGPTLTLDVKMGSTVVASAVSAATIGVTTDRGVTIDVILVCRSTGAGGTVMGDGAFMYHSLNGTGGPLFCPFYKAVTTVDTTASQVLDIFGTWSANTAGNAITITNLTIEYR